MHKPRGVQRRPAGAFKTEQEEATPAGAAALAGGTAAPAQGEAAPAEDVAASAESAAASDDTAAPAEGVAAPAEGAAASAAPAAQAGQAPPRRRLRGKQGPEGGSVGVLRLLSTHWRILPGDLEDWMRNWAQWSAIFSNCLGVLILLLNLKLGPMREAFVHAWVHGLAALGPAAHVAAPASDAGKQRMLEVLYNSLAAAAELVLKPGEVGAPTPTEVHILCEIGTYVRT